MSQLEVSLQSGISARHYQEIEYGRKNCQIDTLTKILKIYNINVFSFFSSFLIDEFNENGVEALYDIFGDKVFGYRRFDLQGTVTYQCAQSVAITGMTDEQVIGKMKIWSDLSDSAMVNFIMDTLKTCFTYLPLLPSWKVKIKNHALNTYSPYIGFARYTKDENKTVIGIEIIIFPLDTD